MFWIKCKPFYVKYINFGKYCVIIYSKLLKKLNSVNAQI